MLKTKTESILQDLKNCQEDNCDTCKYYNGDCALELVKRAEEVIRELYNSLYICKEYACPQCGSTDYDTLYESQTLVYYVGPPDKNPNKRCLTVRCRECGNIYSFNKGFSNV